ncbi:MAG TPA: hypothetical protein VH475_29395 [Tepidisphaeraceae bacterium]|jgi:hypothetical protein
MRTLPLLTLLAIALAGCADKPSPPPLQVGLATREITPPLGYRMAGYFYERRATAVHDPLCAKAVVFRQGNTRFALALCDLCQTASEVVEQARALASEKTGIPPDHIAVASTHTHTGPDYFGPLADHLHALAIVANQGADPAQTMDYPSVLATRIAEAIIAADRDADHRESAARLTAGSAPQPSVAFNRRYVMKDGTVAWNPGKKNPNIVRPAGPIEPDVSFLTITRNSGAPDAILTNFPLHPDTIGGTEFSADFPHYIESTLRERLGAPNLIGLFAQGTSGNINHVDVSTDRPQSGQAESERIGAAIGQCVADALPGATPTVDANLRIATTRIDLPLQQYTPEEVASARALFATIQERKLPFLVGVKATKIVKIYDRYHGQPIWARVQAVRLADDTAIVLLPSELFVEFGLAIKRQSPFAHTFVIELANDSFGYVPTMHGFKEGAYEPTNATVRPGAGERLTEAAVQLLGQLKRD